MTGLQIQHCRKTKLRHFLQKYKSWFESYTIIAGSNSPSLKFPESQVFNKAFSKNSFDMFSAWFLSSWCLELLSFMILEASIDQSNEYVAVIKRLFL